MRVWREQKLSSPMLLKDADDTTTTTGQRTQQSDETAVDAAMASKVDFDLTRMVEHRVHGYRRTASGSLRYDTSLLRPDTAVQFREGVRLGNPLKVNADILTALAKKELQHGRIEEAAELYEHAVSIDPRDGRAYLGLANCGKRIL